MEQIGNRSIEIILMFPYLCKDMDSLSDIAGNFFSHDYNTRHTGRRIGLFRVWQSPV